MSTRTTLTSVTFTRPFLLSAVEGAQPAGTYRVVTEEEPLEGLSFGAYLRTATMIYLPAAPAPGQTRQVVPVDPDELSALLAADKDQAALGM
ncbi:hypothetical protein [Reyranella sp.]|uniref:hypothetical protein n=1 Tax=Reyranella sp. TaxID=1929291 RepID=UPI003BAC4753